MRLVMTLLCRNEADIVESNILFHLHQGVNFIIAMNNLSVDRTGDILERYQKKGVLKLLEQHEDTHDQGPWVTGMARMAQSEYGADWVIDNDADEFWWPKHGTLKDTLALVPNENDMLRVPRWNFIPSASETGPFYERMQIREVLSYNSIGKPLPPKVCHRAYPDIIVADGNHSARRAGAALRGADGAPFIEILHFPVRTYAQLERKVLLGTAAVARNARLGAKICITWRWLAEEHRNGRLYDYYREQHLDSETLVEGIRSGKLVKDDRLSHFFRARQCSGVPAIVSS
jgi:hypothetical protein